jgi:hypothetical protein
MKEWENNHLRHGIQKESPMKQGMGQGPLRGDAKEGEIVMR